MLPFLHDRVQALERLLASSGDVLAKYNRLDLDLAPTLTAFLDQAIDGYRALGLNVVENRLLALKAEWVSAGQGMNPLTLERVATHKRAMQRAIALRVLQHSAEQLRTDIERATGVLAQGEAPLRAIVLAAHQKRLLPRAQAGAITQRQLEQLWRALLADADLQLAARQLAMQLSLPDTLLLMSDLIQAIRPAAN
jgi:hypothetical protein